MSTPYPMPQQAISLSLADPFTTPDWTDITGLVKSWSGTVRGRQHELQRFEAGNSSLVLNNNDGRFSPWNTAGPYYNLVSANDASQDSGLGTWQTLAGSNCAILRAAPPVVVDGPFAVKIVGGGGTPSTLVAGQLPAGGHATVYAVTAGQYYSAMCSFLTSVTARAWTLGVQWYKSDGTTLISTATSASVNDNTSTWTKASILGAQAPALAAFAVLIATGTSLGNLEVHWACRAALFNWWAQLPNTAWAPGQRQLGPGRPVKNVATWSSTPYSVFFGYVDNWIPKYGQVTTEQVISVSDGLKLLAVSNLDLSVYPTQVVTDGATAFYRLGEPIGSLAAADATGNNAAATVQGPVVFGASAPLFLVDPTTSAMFSRTQFTSVQLNTPYVNGPALTGTAYSVEALFNIGSVSASNDEYIFAQRLTAGDSFGPAVNIFINNLGGSHPGAIGCEVADGAGTSYGIVWGPTGKADGNWHHVVLTRSGTTLTLYVDGVAYGPTTLSANHVTVAGLAMIGQAYQFGNSSWGGSLGDVALYAGIQLTSAKVTNHYALFSAGWVVQNSGTRIGAILNLFGWPAAKQSLATGISLVQATTAALTQQAALGYIQTIEATEQGAFFQDGAGVLQFYDRHYVLTNALAATSNATFASDTAGGHFHFVPQDLIPAEDDLDLWNDVPAQRQGGVLQRAQDLVSAKQYSRRTLQGYTSGLQTNDNEVLGQAQWLLAHYAYPITRVRQIKLDNVADDGANLPQMLGRGILDRITLIWKPIDGSSVSLTQDSLIGSITHEVTQSRWVTTWQLSPAETQGYLVLNDAVYGKLDQNRLGY